MKNDDLFKKIFKSLNHYLIFFLLIAFVITCSTALFVSTLADTLNIDLTEQNIAEAAKITFLNVILLSIIITIIDAIRRKITVEEPVKNITEATHKIVKGDFSVRIEKQNELFTDENFNEIIECFNKMTEELSSVETLRSDFIANVSHEMKTPLAVMKNYATLLQSENLSEEKRIEYAKGVSDNARKMSEMMANILKLNRLENQQIYPKIGEINLSEQLCDCLLQFESIWEEKEIELETDILQDVYVKADAELLSLVWNNLFSNAFKFTNNGGKVSVSLFASEHHATINVKDTGCGMTKEVGEHIFEKFYQGDTSRSTQGNGLGLALVKRVMDIMNGEINVESVLNEGTTFTIKIRRI